MNENDNKYLIFNFYKKFKFFFFIFIQLFLYKFNLYKKINKHSKNGNIQFLKICLCTLGKKENLYIKEFIEHYKKIGVDKIFLYDNNDIDGERFEEVILDYINSGFIELINFRGVPKAIYKVMRNCYKNNYNIFDWLIFYEIDEFIFLKNYSNIKTFLNQKKFKKCLKIHLNWLHRSDNNLIYYDNRTLAKRFVEKGENVKKKINYLALIKTIIRGHIPNITITDIHKISLKIKGCNGFGKIAKIKGNRNIEPDYKYYYINHYYSKSTEEFTEKLKRGDMQFGNSTNNYYYQIRKYFYINKITTSKIDYLENKLKINLLDYRKKIKTN